MISTILPLLQITDPTVALDHLNSCVIKIGDFNVRLNDVAALNSKSKTYPLANGATCTVSFKDGFLAVTTTADVNIRIKGKPNNAKAIYVATGGDFLIETGGRTLDPIHGIYIKAKRAVFSAPIDSPGILKIDSTNAAGHSVSMLKTVTVRGADLTTGRLFTNSEFNTSKLSATCDTFEPGSRSNLNAGVPITAANTSTLDPNNPIHRAFIDANAALAAKPRSVIKARVMVLQGRMQNLGFLAKEQISVKGKIFVENVILKSSKVIVSWGNAIAGTKLTVKGYQFVVRTLGDVSVLDLDVRSNYVESSFLGRIQGREKYEIKSLYTKVSFGGRLAGMDVIAYTGQYINFLGVVSAHNFVVDTFFPVDAGATVPYIPYPWDWTWNELKAAVNVPKFLSALKAVASYIFRPLGIILRAVLKVRTIMMSLEKMQKVFSKAFREMDSSDDEKAAVNCLPTIHGPKSLTDIVKTFCYYPVIKLIALAYMLPRSWADVKDATYKAKLLAVIAVKIVSKLSANFVFLRTGENDMESIEDELQPCDGIDNMMVLLAAKNILYAADAVLEARNLRDEYRTSEVKIPTDYYAVGERAAKLVLPCRVVDSIMSFRAGASATGYEVLTHSKEAHARNKTRNLLSHD